MANYKKPQSPLQHKDGDYFYPLTTVDQIIVDDNTRLNSKLDHILTVDFSDAGNADATGVNADTLGGYAADEYAKAATVDNMLEIDLYGATAGEPNLVDADTLGGFDINHFASAEEMNGKLSMELLWENGSPSSEFAAQTVDINSVEGTHALIEFRVSASGANFVMCMIAKMGKQTELHRITPTEANSKFIIMARYVTVNSDKIVFGDAWSGTAVNTPSVNNAYCVPTKIYIIKGVSA